jgi:hypothetical protein
LPARCDVHCRQHSIGSAGVTIRHRDDDRLLQAKDVAQFRMASERFMIASSVVPDCEERVDTFLDKQAQKCGTSGDCDHGRFCRLLSCLRRRRDGGRNDWESK